MNSFETDIKRAVLSWGFAFGLAAELIILFTSGLSSDAFRMSVPVLCTLPYSTAWLSDYQSGYIKVYLHRCKVPTYILGKILACGISGGLLEMLGCQIFLLIKNDGMVKISLSLIFMSGMLWAIFSAVLAAISNSRYLAYGGAFVIYYLLVILHERYFPALYCLYPYEWQTPQHTWVFGETGILLLLGGISAVLVCLYYEWVRRCIDGV